MLRGRGSFLSTAETKTVAIGQTRCRSAPGWAARAAAFVRVRGKERIVPVGERAFRAAAALG
jgi:hypothetical protein